ncbi:MAG TPA: ROK family protein [Candidatus Sulfomarinibacteraceae bacterium]|nr:ROK family protein [Candidatus Sulfomarinibacteraceae bacterium]
MKQYLAGIDVGGTKIEATVAAAGGSIVGRAVTPTDSSGGEGLLYTIHQALDQALAAAGVTRDRLVAIGVGVPGQVDRDRGVVRLAVNLNLTSYPLGAELAQGLHGAPVVVENDVRLAAMGVYRHLQQSNPIHSLAYLSIGTGISAGVVCQGQLYRGAGGMAGEIGHIVVAPDGPLCNCGLRGCLEAVASGPAIASSATAFLNTDSRDQNSPPLSTAAVYRAAQEGHPQAQELIQQVSIYISRAIHLLAMTYDVERIVLGGGVTGAGDAFWNPVAAQLAHLRRQSPLAASMLPPERVITLSEEINPGILGALALAEQAASDHFLTSRNP